ncbi:GNAT family N-acetyltransferase [Algibacter amylolyticus]|uniref:GNAT family N-acetyltransferase n=1 Tax=Algibacter amylolyticus TaxID=1608400 RepID=A0A5M7BE60_9FLAO|nr:GNAT family protein [Algibacter amylolyticus]KAA5827886.1 GNAT family N-acetyltransferase [Algibacter amylolyticus]MBB5267117.1 RimJ/RimL family protein N-acetyltransferase [Algibacter amylolyticus]TSJ82131.1 GNAT family N-acetyltransferase [Algibacter amylolyticus]
MSELDFSKDYILENDKVRLSPLKMEHVESLLDISEETNLWTYFLEKGNGLKNLTNYISSTVNNRKHKKEYPFIVFDKIKNRYAGTTRFYDYSKELKNIKLGHTWYGKSFRGTGLNKHTKYLLFEFAFEKLKVERVGFGAHAENKVSIAAMKGVGCKEEGVLRSFMPSLNNTGRANIILLSVLKEEWDNTIQFKLKNKLTNTD